MISHRDISESKRAELEVRERERELLLIANNMPGPVARLDKDLRYLFVNQQFEAEFGKDREEIVGYTMGQVMDEQTFAVSEHFAKRALMGEQVMFSFESQDQRRGKVYWLIRYIPEKDDLGNVIGFFDIASDVTAGIKTESELRAKERELWLITNRLPGPVARLDCHGRYLFANEVHASLFRKPIDEILGKPIDDIWGLDQYERLMPAIDSVLKGNATTIEMETCFAATEATHHLVHLVPDRDEQGSVIGFFLISFDITELKKAEAAKQEALNRLQKIASNIPGVVYQYRRKADGSISFPYASERIKEFFGVSGEELSIDASTTRFIVDRAAFVKSIDLSAENMTPWSYQFQLRFDDGTERWCSGQALPEREPDGSILWHGVIMDITERVRAEADLALSTELLELTGELAKVGGWEVDVATKKLFWTTQTYRIHELEPGQEITVDEAIQFYAPEARPKIQHAVEQAMLSGDPWDIELPLITATGKTLMVRAQGVAMRDPKTGELKKLAGAFQDVTAQKKAEEVRASLEVQLRESQKMEAVGTLAGGIAHDFNNILAIILGSVELIRQEILEESLSVQNAVEEIKLAAERAHDLVRQILSFGRRQRADRKPLSLRPVVDESIRLLRSTLPARVRLEHHCAKGIPNILADAVQIEQVIINLATNAMQAIANECGTITIRLDAVEVLAGNDPLLTNPALGELLARKPKRLLRLTVKDDGCGMDSTTLGRIFEPFFTTKSLGEGTGLGLAVVHGIVQSHEGAIVVESEVGVGSTFSIFFPESTTNAKERKIQRRDLPPSKGLVEAPHILYIDDEEPVLRSYTYLLELRGYRVSGYLNQKEAIEAIRANPNDFALAVSDYNMPGMSGLEFAREVKKIRPDLSVAITSGYIDRSLQDGAEEVGVSALIPKPCDFQELYALLDKLVHS